MMGIGVRLLEAVAPLMETIAPYLPGKRPVLLHHRDVSTGVAGGVRHHDCRRRSGSFLLIRNMSPSGRHRARFLGGVAVVQIGTAFTLEVAAVFAVVAAVLISNFKTVESSTVIRPLPSS